MSLKRCRDCQLEKPLGEFYPDRAFPDGIKAVCRACHNKRDADYKRRRKLQKSLENAPDKALRLETNRIGLELMALQFSKEPGTVLAQPVQIEGAAFPVPRGVIVEMGNLGPIVTFQTPTQRIKKSLAIEPIAHIAAEMDLWKVQIVLEGLPVPEWRHPLAKAVKQLGRFSKRDKDLKI